MATILDEIRSKLAEIAEHGPRQLDPPPEAPAMPDELTPSARKRSRIVEIDQQAAGDPGIDLADCRDRLDDAMRAYIEAPHVTYRLLCAIPPGVGKTYYGVKHAEEAARRGLRVIYIAPRHDFYQTILETSAKQGGDPTLWFHWLPRQGKIGRDGQPQPETCHLTSYMDQWIKKGQAGKTFCAGVCGYRYMNDVCAYYEQERNASHRRADGTYKILVIQHAHLVAGHSLLEEADLVIGDESPLAIYPRIWQIPAAHMIPSNLKATDPAHALVSRLRGLAGSIAADQRSSGRGLLDYLGGPQAVLDVAKSADVIDLPVAIHTAEAADAAPYDYVYDLLALLAQEARAELAGAAAWVPRVIVDPSGVTLLLKKETANELPPRVIWLDATADAELYRGVVGWHVESFAPFVRLQGPVMQVTDSLYTKGTMVNGEKPSPRARDVARLIREIASQHGYTSPLVVSYRELVPLFDGWAFTHFHGNRGSNSFEDCDSVFILGTPQPPIEQIELTARMLFPTRTQPFNARWVDKLTPYAGTDRGYYAAGLWADPDLARILSQLREAEIVQSAHRVRPIVSSKPIWLMTALPVAQLPPTRLMTAAQALGITVEDVDALTFMDVIDIARAEIDRKGHCTTLDVMTMLEITRQTAYRYFDALEQFDPVSFAPLKIRAVGGRGRPARGVGLQSEE